MIVKRKLPPLADRRVWLEKAAYLRKENLRYGEELVQLELQQPLPGNCCEVWRSRAFLVQVYKPEHGAQRFTVNRTMVNHLTGGWMAGITWDELQVIKRGIGRGDKDAVEVFPKDKDMVYVANMRYIWILDKPLDFAWRNTEQKAQNGLT